MIVSINISALLDGTDFLLKNATISTFNSLHPEVSRNNVSLLPFGHNLSEQFSKVTGICFFTIIIVAVVCNIILISSIVFIRRLHSVLHVFIVNLTVSDLITAIGSIPFDVEYMFRGYFPHGTIACGIINTVFLISLPSSVLSLTLLTAERLIVILYPYQANNILTKRVVVIILAVVWCYVFAVALFPIIYEKNAALVIRGNCYFAFPIQYSIFMVSVNFVLPIVIICGANVVLFIIAQKHHREHAKTIKRLFQSNNSSSKDRPSGSRCSKYERKQESPKYRFLKINNNFKAAKRIALLVGVFLVCWLSYIIIVASNVICWCNPQELTWIGNIVNYSATAINPILYGLLDKSIRHEVRNIIRRHILQRN